MSYLNIGLITLIIYLVIYSIVITWIYKAILESKKLWKINAKKHIKLYSKVNEEYIEAISVIKSLHATHSNILDDWVATESQLQKECDELKLDLKQAVNQRDYYADMNAQLRQETSRDYMKINRALVKMQIRWLMHYKGFPILREAVKSLVNLNISMWRKNPEGWPLGFVIKNILIEAGPKDTIESEAWAILNAEKKALNWTSQTPIEWKNKNG